MRAEKGKQVERDLKLVRVKYVDAKKREHIVRGRIKIALHDVAAGGHGKVKVFVESEDVSQSVPEVIWVWDTNILDDGSVSAG